MFFFQKCYEIRIGSSVIKKVTQYILGNQSLKLYEMDKAVHVELCIKLLCADQKYMR